MRILALADIHESFDSAHSIIRSESPLDLVLLVGDLTTHGRPERARQAVTELAGLSPHILAIAGNMDSREIDDIFLEEGMGINGRGVIVGDVGLFGVSGCPPSRLHTPYERSEEEIMETAERGWKEVVSARVKIFVPHAPPYGTTLDRLTNGIHVGSKSIASFVHTYHPDLLLCGHIHESHGVDSMGATPIVNCGSVRDGRYAVVEIDNAINVILRRA